MAVTTADERTPATGQTGLPPLIPREILFGNPERTNPQLSPDGKHLAYLAPDEKNVLQVWLQPAEGGADQPAQVLTADKKRGIHSFFWTYLPGQATGATMAPQPGAETPGAAPAPRSGAETAPLLIYAQDADGDENFHLFAVDAAARLV